MGAETLTVALPAGEVTVSAELDVPPGAWAAVAVAHGAGAGMRHPWLVAFTEAMSQAGLATLRFNFPYVEAGRRMPGPAPHAIRTWEAAAARLAAATPGLPQWAAGKSYGGRMASMAAADGVISPAGLVYLGYPFHPPGQPEKTRGAHLASIAVRQVFDEGRRDPFIDPHADFEAVVAGCADAEIVWVDGGHSFEAGRSDPAGVGARIGALVAARLRG